MFDFLVNILDFRFEFLGDLFGFLGDFSSLSREPFNGKGGVAILKMELC